MSSESPNKSLIPAGALPPLKIAKLPEPIPLRRMIGPGIMLAGLALGSGEFVLWPYITYRSGFVFFWACILGIATQYFLNTEIMRWTLATGESATTGFIRLGRYWAGIFLVLNIVPWMLPGWAKGAAQIFSWLVWGPEFVDGKMVTAYQTPLAIAGMLLCGAILTAGPVIYETVERIQMVLVSSVMILVIVLAVWLLKDRPDAILAQAKATVTFGYPDFVPPMDLGQKEGQDAEGESGEAASGDGSESKDVISGIVLLSPMLLLGAIAFAGAGGTTNLGESNYVKDKGYGMGALIGRITSPVTGKEEPVSEIGSHFPHDEANLARWRRWWWAACTEHFFSFFLTCVICLVLLTLISYTLFFDADGNRLPEAAQYEQGMGFIWGQADLLRQNISPWASTIFLVMGVAILLTTEFGVLDVVSRISGDIVKTAFLRDNLAWSESRLYYLFLWSTILLGIGILLLETAGINVGALSLFKLSAAMNGGVMFLYSCTLLYMNWFRLPKPVRIAPWRAVIMLWSIAFFGSFSAWAVWDGVRQIFAAWS